MLTPSAMLGAYALFLAQLLLGKASAKVEFALSSSCAGGLVFVNRRISTSQHEVTVSHDDRNQNNKCCLCMCTRLCGHALESFTSLMESFATCVD